MRVHVRQPILFFRLKCQWTKRKIYKDFVNCDITALALACLL